jgi:hypothetical protein
LPEEGTVNLETWNKVGDGLKVCYSPEGLECMPIFTVGLWSMVKGCLGPTPSYKERFSFSVFDPGCGTHPLQSDIQECKRQYPLKEQNAAASRAAEPSTPPYEDKFSHKVKIHSKDNLDSDSVSDEKSQDVPAHQALGTMHLGLFPWAKRFPTLKSPLQAALQATHSQGEDTASFKFYPVLERPDPNNPGMQQRFH